MISTYASFIIKNSKLIIVVSLFLVILPIQNLGKIGLSNDIRAYFSEDNKYRSSLELLEDTFGNQDNLLIYIEDRSGDIFNNASLNAVAEMTEELWQTPYSKRVDSLTNFQRTKADGDELTVNFLLPDASSLDDNSIQEVKAFAITEPSLLRRIIAPDSKATAINITFNFPESDPNSIEDIPTLAAKDAKQFVSSIIENAKRENPQLIIQLGGVVAANLTMAEAIEADLALLLPLSYLFLFSVIYLFTKSFTAVLLTITVVTLSILAALGIYSITGRPLTPATGFVPTAIMAIAVADCVHFLVGYFNNAIEGKEHKASIASSLEKNTSPIIITSITTIIGLLGLNFSESQPYRDMGNTMAIGVGVALFLTLTFLPAMLSVLPKLKAKKQDFSKNKLNKLADVVIAKPRLMCIATSIAILIGVVGFLQNEVSERWYLYFGEDFEIRKSVESINKNLSGIHTFHYTLDSGEENGIYNPEFWLQVESFSEWFRSQPKVAHVDTMSDILKSINKNMNGGESSFYSLPDNRELIAQYLLVYQFSLPQGLGIETYLNTNRSAIRLTATINKSNSSDMAVLDNKARAWLEKNAPLIKPIHGTGMDLMFSRVAQDNAISLLKGTLLILMLVSLILLVVLKSTKLGIISLIPNLAPAILAYGIWGYFSGVIDLSSSVVICISLGIVVDDTVHFLSKYKFARQELDYNAEESIRYSFQAVGSALVITTLALVAGFLITVLSSFQPSANIGMLLSLTLSLALIIDLILLPALLLIFDKDKPKTSNN